jgi:hypothetical protein
MELIKQQRHESEWGSVQFFGHRGIVGMMLFLTMQIMLNFCWLYTRLCIGSTCGLSSYQRISGFIWILDALA